MPTVADSPKTLVIAPQSARLARIAPNHVRLGWRIICQNGEPYDSLWGSALPERLNAVVNDLKKKYGPLTVLDLRDRPEDVRDSDYYMGTGLRCPDRAHHQTGGEK